MNYFIKMVPVLLCLFACQHDSAATDRELIAIGGVENIEDKERHLFFRLVSGAQGKDTLAISLFVQDNEVTGKMERIIYEKDRRSGTIHGQLKSGVIHAIWTFMQEGVLDSNKLEFRIIENGLLQKEEYANGPGGRDSADSSGFKWLSIPRVSCD
jgi:hypothetical protein